MAAFHPEAAPVLAALSAEIQGALGERVRAVYLFGSLARGDFDEGVSDIDLVVAHTGALGDADLARLGAAHVALTRRFPGFKHRLELNYIEAAALRRYEPNDRQARMSPGEPFHVTTVGSDWILNRRLIRDRGVALMGPPASTMIDPVSDDELRAAVQSVADEWWAWIERETEWPRPLQSYAILTTCRILHTLERGEVVSKRAAAAWASSIMGADAGVLIRRAWEWRARWREPGVDGSETLPATLAFLTAARERIERRARARQIVADGYDALGDRYRAWSASLMDHPREEWLDQVLRLLPDGAAVLDLGCGPGTTARGLAERFDVSGIDISEVQIDFARRVAPRARFVVGDVLTTNFPTGSFDAVVALHSLIHVPLAAIDTLLCRIATWLRPGGLLLATLGTVPGEAVQDDWLGVPMFFAGDSPEGNRLRLGGAGFALLRDEVVDSVEPGEGEVSFHWVLAQTGADTIA